MVFGACRRRAASDGPGARIKAGRVRPLVLALSRGKGAG